MIKINNNFIKITEHANNIDNLLNTLQQKKLYLKHTYEELVNDNTTIDVIATDTFAFQNNIFELKIQNNINIYKKISNHLYGDYYKLIRYITSYIDSYILQSESKILDETIMNSVKLIDKIEPYKLNKNHDEFNIKSAEQINNYIIDLLEILNKNYKKLDDYIKTREKSLNLGINIENYIDNVRYNNESLKHNIELFNNFLNKYHLYHIKYLSFLQSDIKKLYDNIVSEIDFNNINLSKDEFTETIDDNDNIIIEKKITKIEKYKEKFLVMSRYIKMIMKINLVFFSLFMVYLFI